jgi:hypothetical protein
LRRYFTDTEDQPTNRFDQNGRLFRGFWLNLKRERRVNIRIDGEEVADLDYKNCFARLAYAWVGQEPPEDDLFDLGGLLKVADYSNSNPKHRDAVKESFNSLLNGGRADSADSFVDLPKGTNTKALRRAIVAKHPKLRQLFGTSVGLKLMLVESRILLDALERLMATGVVALPCHDGLLVAQSDQEIAKAAMEEAAMAVVGREMLVAFKPLRKQEVREVAQAA